MNACRRHRGFALTAEVVSALAIVSVLAVMLASAVGRERAAGNHLADSRAAVRLAERAVLALQLHQPIKDAGGAVKVKRVPADSPAAAPGCAWVDVQASVNGHSAALTALVPAADVPAPPAGATP